MSKNRKRKWRKLDVKEVDDFSQPVRINKSNASRIMDWILYGEKGGPEALQKLMPVRMCNCPLCV